MQQGGRPKDNEMWQIWGERLRDSWTTPYIRIEQVRGTTNSVEIDLVRQYTVLWGE